MKNIPPDWLAGWRDYFPLLVVLLPNQRIKPSLPAGSAPLGLAVCVRARTRRNIREMMIKKRHPPCKTFGRKAIVSILLLVTRIFSLLSISHPPLFLLGLLLELGGKIPADPSTFSRIN